MSGNYVDDFNKRMDLLSRYVQLTSLTPDDYCLLRQAHDVLLRVQSTKREIDALFSEYEDSKQEVKELPTRLEQLLEVAHCVNTFAAASRKPEPVAPTVEAVKPIPQRCEGAAAAVAARKIARITEEEFDKIPKYMKGRQSLEAINKKVDEFNKAVASKYELLALPKAQLKEAAWKKVLQYRSQQSHDTRGVRFLVEDDLKANGFVFQSSKVVGSFITIMRHCCRVREIRGPERIVRFAVV